MKKNERLPVMAQILIQNPGHEYTLGFFASMFSCAKSSVSEDLTTLRDAFEHAGYGRLQTLQGSRGGIVFIPCAAPSVILPGLQRLCLELGDSTRNVGGGFIYTTDLMFDPEIVTACANAFAVHYAGRGFDIAVTIETRGVGIAMETARLLGIPLVVIRREARVSDGPTLSINYYSGSSGRMQKMSLPKRSVKPGQKALIIDDFMKHGYSLSGARDMLLEFSAVPASVATVIVSEGIAGKQIEDFYPLIILTRDEHGFHAAINPEL